MRRKALLIILLPLLLTGCKNEFESIFDANNPEVTRNEILQMFPAINYFGAIYPKLPDRAVEMNRWNNY